MVDLKGDINKTITKEIKEAITHQVNEALRQNLEAIDKSTKALENSTQKQSNTMKSHLNDYKNSQKRFFQMDGIREIIFWVSSVSGILLTILVGWYLVTL
jgi:predicted solute-binding protein